MIINNLKFFNDIDRRTFMNIVNSRPPYEGSILTHESDVIGAIQINKTPNKSIYLKHNINPNISISMIYILTKFRNQNFGTVSVNNIVNEYKKVCLTTGIRSHSSMIKILEDLNFDIIEEKSFVKYWYKEG